jgi:signal transduction histidine kinase
LQDDRRSFEAQGGEIRVSTSQGPGTQVSFTLPVHRCSKTYS